MPKMFFSLLLLILMGSCKEAPSNTTDDKDSSWNITASELPKKTSVNTKANLILKDWMEYTQLETSFDQIYKSEFREDFVLVIEDLIEKQKILEKSVYPSEFDIPQIKGRQKVLKTYILKTKGDLEYRQNPEASIKEMITTFNVLREQFNVEVNNTLSEDLILNEKD